MQIDRDEPRTGLADQLKQRTRELHREAEQTGVIGDLLQGRLGVGRYGLLLCNLLVVYEALEAALEQSRHLSFVECVAWRDLYRTDALRSDVAQLVGNGWADTMPIVAGTRAYVQRIVDVAREDAALLIAHAYVRYLGDLNGGQVLKRLIGRRLELAPATLSFYDFAGTDDPKALARSYRSAIDQAGDVIADRESVLREAVTVFRLNIALSSDIQHALLRLP